MSILIVIIHVVVAVALILIVLLQTGKGADMGAAFGGGGSQTLFGSTGASSFLSRLTTIAAVVFMLTSLVLAYMSSHRRAESVTSRVSAPVTEQTGQEAGPRETVPAQEGAPETAMPMEQTTAGDAAVPASEEAGAERVPVHSQSPPAEGGSAAEKSE